MEQFMNDVINALKMKLGGKYQVFPKEQRKNNGLVLHGICIHKENEDISPIVYPEKFILPYIVGILDAEKIADLLLEQYCPEEISQNAAAHLKDFGLMKEKVRIKLINHDANMGNLENCPYRKFLDLAITYYLDMELVVAGQNASISVTNELMEVWGVCEDELYRLGMEKLRTKDACHAEELFTVARKIAQEEQDEEMEEALAELEKEQKDSPGMYVVSNRKNFFGASCLLNIPYLREMAERKECDLIIYPCSVDEIIVLPLKEKTGDCMDTEDIRQINVRTLPKEKRLSNNIYRYDRAKQEVSIYRKGGPL